MIERLSPGTRKIELFGRPHNVQPNWYDPVYLLKRGSEFFPPIAAALFVVIYLSGFVLLSPFTCRVTLGNQLDGIHLLDPEVVARFKKRYPDGVISKP